MPTLFASTTVYLKDVEDMFKAESSAPNTALLLLVPIRLGSDALNVIYIPCIKVGVIIMMSFVRIM